MAAWTLQSALATDDDRGVLKDSEAIIIPSQHSRFSFGKNKTNLSYALSVSLPFKYL